MIERLVATLRQLAALDDGEIASPRYAGVRGDCADALRLELDCPQQSLTPAQRSVLTRLSDVLEADLVSDELVDAVRAASHALDIAPT